MTAIDPNLLKRIVEAALMAADEPLSVDRLCKLFAPEELEDEQGRTWIREALATLETESAERGYELKRVASGYRYQVRQELGEWVGRLWDEKPPRYTRALLETLALIAYKQPVTRGDIEQVRGVAVSQNIMRTLSERGWIRAVGQREVPGKPSLYGTTRAFLDYFNLKSLDQLPPLAEINALIEPLLVAEADAERAEADAAASELAGDQEITVAETGADDDNRSSDVEDSDAGNQETENAAQAEPPEHSGHEGEDEEQRQQSPSAEVVRLPTAPRR